eukprot:GILI01004475.1.p1 GENE.GILI01004475.1~~GILI01004475.1.p1  ORF type:complete len:388 (+),score=46.59 GILI01004475.1:51-1214(+)
MSSGEDHSPPPPMGPPPTGRSTLTGHRSLTPPSLARTSPSRTQPTVSADQVRPSNIRHAAETLAPMRLQLNDLAADRGRSVAEGRVAVTPPGRYLMREEEVTNAEGDVELICIYTRPDGVEVISRSVQTEFNKRHKQLGIVFRSKSMSWVAIYIMFLAPMLVIFSICSYYTNWRPLFQIWNAETNAEYEGGSPPLWLLFLGAANFHNLIFTYLCVMPTAFKTITSDEEENAYRDVLTTVVVFLVAFLPVWVGEFGISFVLPYDKTHSGTWASAIVFWVGGFLAYSTVWLVYSTYMAELLHAKARKAADDYLKALQLGMARRRAGLLNRGYSKAKNRSSQQALGMAPSTTAVTAALPTQVADVRTQPEPEQQRSQEAAFDSRGGAVGY